MKKTVFTLAVLVCAVTLAFGSALSVEANGNGNGHQKGTPGNSAFGRSHNPIFGNSVMWGGQSFSNLEALIQRLQTLLAELRAERPNKEKASKKANVGIVTEAATDVDETSATLNAEVDLRDEDEAEVLFEYWTRSKGKLKVQRTDFVTIVQDDDESVSVDISGLREDAEYHFRAVAKDEDGKRVYGKKLTFTTSDEDEDEDEEDEDENEEAPSVDTENADDVSSTTAELNGEVAMNDFDNGTVFFVYGESEEDIEDVADDFDTYADVDEDGDDLQKVLIDSDLDDEDDYSVTVTGLDEETKHYFALAVAYEDENGDEVIKLGIVRSFTTE